MWRVSFSPKSGLYKMHRYPTWDTQICFNKKQEKTLAFSPVMCYHYFCVIGVLGESMPTNTVQAVSPYYNPVFRGGVHCAQY